ncbi:MAG: DUF1835 domain-containing protein [Salinimicrobium sp.]
MKKKKFLHICNGDDLAEKVQDLGLDGEYIVWREMLCEGPTAIEVGEKEFLDLRKNFLKKSYGIQKKEYSEKFETELNKLAVLNDLDEVVLWFEFDLFSHMNMLALISFLLQNNKSYPLSLVCSRKLKGEKEMQPLSELSNSHLKKHYKHRINLTKDDVSIAQLIWEFYCGKDPKRLISEIKKTTNFEYLSSSIRAHIERFPNASTGLNTLERNVLKLIKEHEIKNRHHLLGYALQYQGYYGYVDVQMERVLDKLSLFYTVSDNGIKLNEEGDKALEASKNYYQKLKDDEFYGGVRKYEFLYDSENHYLLKL